ncbi:hypothetical protein [Undibacterium sp. Ji49W]|uniref:hypothetical protein n=1 Tax=Undibacterium sp. Ji49W TaxID=3413040 RepID=UPI003BF2CF10
MNELFTEIRVWRRPGDVSAVRYSCLHNLQSQKFAVQSADFFRLPFKSQLSNELERQFVELFIETSPTDSAWFDSLQDAIEQHALDFL